MMNYSLYPKCRTLTEDQISPIIKLYESGTPIPKIAKQLNITNYVSIVKLLDFNNIRKKLTRKGFIDSMTKYTKLDNILINQMVADKKSIKEIAEAAQCTTSLIAIYIKKNKLSLIDYEQRKFRDTLLQHKDEVIQLYEKYQNLAKVGTHFDCNGTVISEFFDAINYSYIKNNFVDLTPHLEEIKQLYYVQNLTLFQIGEIFRCSYVKIGEFLRKNGFPYKDKTELLRTRNKSEEFQKKCISSSGRKKEYILPSGKTLFLRGYEPNFLDHIFKNDLLSENDIIPDPKRIKYIFENKACHYYPDFYIPKLNLIVETKSKWILNKQGVERNLAKEHATKQNGFNFLLIVNNNFQQFNEFLQTHQKE